MSAYQMKMPETVEDAFNFLQACEQLTAVSINVTADARRHWEMLLRQRRATFVIVGGTKLAGRAGA